MQKQEGSQAKYAYCIIAGDQRRVFGQEGIGGPDNQVYVSSQFSGLLRGYIEGFSRRVEELKSANAEKRMEFALSGPWPPYNFVRLEDERRQ
ncbi:MAG: hypothetical protein CVU38_00925 [Chloroflexi bacterium HGW-Chloroflexi-1]|nr:MAG: hypothetical protein CVU38_00925 [Chloroflexi bacterium HGW-Chloroflexi-1]